MPELPEVEAIRRRLARQITGRRIRAAHVLRAGTVEARPVGFARLVTGRTIEEVERRGKNLLIGLSGNYTLRVHLRMTGELLAGEDAREAFEAEEPVKSVRVWFELGGGCELVFKDFRGLGRISAATCSEMEQALAPLGPEPLGRRFREDDFVAQARRSRQPAKLFLMDQTHVAGLGNIYVAEALFHAGIDPRRPMQTVSAPRLRSLHSAIRTVLRKAVRSATLLYKRPGTYRQSDVFGRRVYGREGEPCRVCGREVRRIPQGGRSTYFCPHCQR